MLSPLRAGTAVHDCEMTRNDSRGSPSKIHTCGHVEPEMPGAPVSSHSSFRRACPSRVLNLLSVHGPPEYVELGLIVLPRHCAIDRPLVPFFSFCCPHHDHGKRESCSRHLNLPWKQMDAVFSAATSVHTLTWSSRGHLALSAVTSAISISFSVLSCAICCSRSACVSCANLVIISR